MNQPDLSYIAGGNEKWCNQGKHTFMMQTRNFNSKHLLKEMKIYPQEDLSINIYNNFIHSSPTPKTLAIYINADRSRKLAHKTDIDNIDNMNQV